MKAIRFFLVGPGRVGISLGVAWIRAGHRCVGVEGGKPSSLRRARRALRAPPSRDLDFDLLFVATPDRQIAPVAMLWADRVSWRGRIALHTSGALTGSELAPLQVRGASVGSLHPLASLPKLSTRAGTFRGIHFGVEGDRAAVRLARGLVRDAGGKSFEIPPRFKSVYHLCACLSSGYFLGLLEEVSRRLARVGVDPATSRAALLALAEGTVVNARRMGTGKALTGPIVRGDTLTIRAHLRALGSMPQKWKVLHHLLAGLALDLAVRSGRVSAHRARLIRRALSSPSR